MNFDLSEDEEMLKALAERFVVDHYDTEKRKAFLGEPNGFSPAMWSLLGELGILAAPFSEESEGLALDATGIATIFEALGKGLTVEPVIENVLLAGKLFEATAPEALREEWLPAIMFGERRVALAHAEAGARDNRLWVDTKASGNGSGITLTGEKAFVPAGGGADGFIVSARTSGEPGDAEGVSLYFVPADASGLEIRPFRLADGNLAVALTLDGVAGESLTGGIAEIEASQTLASLARSAEALGIMQRLFEETQEYLRTREQFGTALANFQALQHRMVAQYAVIEQARALLNLALVSEGTDGFAKAVEGARAYIAPASVELGHEMIQFHGGMGVTDELAIGHGHKRLLVLSRWPDSPETALDRFAGVS
ncbi:MAG: acyl-CoA dehydrogenase family protein [Sphingomonadaceae bacterium]